MHSKYDNMHTNRIFNVLNCISNHVNSCINCMLSMNSLSLSFSPKSMNSEIIPKNLEVYLATFSFCSIESVSNSLLKDYNFLFAIHDLVISVKSWSLKIHITKVVPNSLNLIFGLQHW